ncbi:60S ribosomal protein L18a [Cucumispora dikerogammari]|nr:60S ribosomal protein L18a [Cucumispora dikerogammari]
MSVNYLKEYKIYASLLPSTTNPSPQIYTSNIFAKNEITAKSKFNKLINSEQKLKSTKTVILKLEEIIDLNELKVKNYGINIKYRSKNSKVHNIYKEIRATSRTSAVSNLFNNMAGTHKVSSSNIDIINIEEIDNPIRKKNIELSEPKLELFCFKKSLIKNKVSFVKENSKYFN